MPGGGRPRGNEPGGGTMDGKRHQFREARASGRNGHGRRTQMSKKVGVEETRPEGRQWAEWGGGQRPRGAMDSHGRASGKARNPLPCCPARGAITDDSY